VGPEAICFRVVRPYVRTCMLTDVTATLALCAVAVSLSVVCASFRFVQSLIRAVVSRFNECGFVDEISLYCRFCVLYDNSVRSRRMVNVAM